MEDFINARANMVDCQLRPNCVTDPDLLDSFLSVPRERFVSPGQEALAYADRCLDTSAGRAMMPPMFLGKVLQECAVSPDDVILVAACGRGYSCAVLSRMAATVVGLEADTALVAEANAILSDLAADNAAVVERDIATGLMDQGPYDVIVLEGGICSAPDIFIDQLSSGGRLAVFERLNDGTGQAVLYLKSGSTVSRRVLFDALLPVLPGFEAKSGFVF